MSYSTQNRIADVAVLATPADEPAIRTLIQAIEREGWRAVRGGAPAACAVIVWSQTSVGSEELAAQAAEYMNRGRLLQVLLQPEGWWYGQTGQVEPPEPFRYYQGLQVPNSDLNGTEHAVDWFDFPPGNGQKILAELARLGNLARPCDKWDARITFRKPVALPRTREVWLIEYSAAENRLLRRHKVDAYEPLSETLGTAIGNSWRMVDIATGELVQALHVDTNEMDVILPMRERWWRRISRWPMSS
jgi:hypothetical protein